MKEKIISILIKYAHILLGCFLAAFGVESFLLPNNFIDGGITGLSMLLSEIWNVELAIIILLINIPFMLIGSKRIGFLFSVNSALAIACISALLYFGMFPVLTQDKLLSAVFGGMTLGAGIGFAFRGGAVLDGTEIIALIMSKRFGGRVGDIILIFNVCIFMIGALSLGLDSALYSVLTYMAASKTIDFIVYGFGALGVNIISSKSQLVKERLNKELGLSVTKFKGEGGFSNQPQDILLCVCSRFDIVKIKSLVESFDSTAFIAVHKITETQGGTLKQKKLNKIKPS